MFIGLVLIVTAFTGRCPAYSAFGISTCGSRYCDVEMEEKPMTESEPMAEPVEMAEEMPPIEMEKPPAKKKKARKRRKKK